MRENCVRLCELCVQAHQVPVCGGNCFLPTCVDAALASWAMQSRRQHMTDAEAVKSRADAAHFDSRAHAAHRASSAVRLLREGAQWPAVAGL
eukprot:362102-Chlamydomonas_euryale.AAC.4